MSWLSRCFAGLQLVAYIAFLRRLLRTLNGVPIPQSREHIDPVGVAVILPVLNEESRIDACLRSLRKQGNTVAETLVVDGGSTDGTREIVERWAQVDPRIRLVVTTPVPPNWNGKAWGLQTGFDLVAAESTWIVTIDADVRVEPDAIRRVVSFASKNDISSLSVACAQVAETYGLSLVHPSLLAPLVYRFGIPGHVASRLDDVQANGQFAVYRKDAIERVGGLAIARDSLCEDVTLARHLFLAGERVGFFDGDDLASTEMYTDGWECIANWPRSLTLKDRFSPAGVIGTLLTLLLLQVIPLVLALMQVAGGRHPRLNALSRVVLATRYGTLAGMRRAYSSARWTYWLSPLFDSVAFVLLARSAIRRRHVWRGQTMAGSFGTAGNSKGTE